MLSRASWHSTPCFTHSPFALHSAGTPNHVVWEHSMYQTTYTHSTNHLQHHSTKGHHDTLYGSITLPFNSQVLAIFFPFATIPATPHYPVSTDRYSPQYGMLTFLLHSMTNTFFFDILPLSPPLPLSPHFSFIQPVQSRAPLTPLTKF